MTSPAPRPPAPINRRTSPALSLGTNLAAGILGCTLLGVWLDHRFGTGERYTLGGVALGFLYGAYEVWKVVRHMQQEDESTNAENGSDR